ncbi:MAG: DUF4231 domain-containing protein [Roseiflexus sp.]|uniref:DUF4231 domain-containing protein n=1 Tax=Roseiflexus sp. TaxID=2562120 RepID=UPI0025ED868E|nr:DUF4231 domain-containing protein [Roseiflexus sp.]MCL6542210.1 DUF4231 domain-containing protein [Roseiflexus sp.]
MRYRRADVAAGTYFLTVNLAERQRTLLMDRRDIFYGKNICARGDPSMEKIFAPEETRELIRGWLIHARKGWKKHEEAARRLESQYRGVGVASVALSAVVGTTLFASLEASYEPWIRIIAGLLSLSSAVLASLITFHRYEERVEKHRAAAVSYKGALRKLEKLHTMPAGSTLDQESSNRIQEELDEIEKFAPVVPEDINRAVEERFEVYNFVAKAEDLRPEQKDRG